ncbi:hypothetical protein DHL47_09920 [Streptococcus panodentis]|uniref:PrgI family protein n=1 Tax=Streptococcus panodentis TaxID=1581472 RepID=A0ABS5AYG7_9STRE|nr:hypothetical protein [Streptococcus panodentis]
MNENKQKIVPFDKKLVLRYHIVRAPLFEVGSFLILGSYFLFYKSFQKTAFPICRFTGSEDS